MDEINLELKQFILSLDEINFNNFKIKLQEKIPNINIRYDENLVSVSNTFSRKMKNLSNLEKECRSVILDKNTLDIVCYSYDDIYYNQDAKEYILNNGIKNFCGGNSFDDFWDQLESFWGRMSFLRHFGFEVEFCGKKESSP